jgi:hypothetical protein
MKALVGFLPLVGCASMTVMCARMMAKGHRNDAAPASSSLEPPSPPSSHGLDAGIVRASEELE